MIIDEIEKTLPWITEGVYVELIVDPRAKKFCETKRLAHAGWRWERSEDGKSSKGGHDPVTLRIGSKATVTGYRIVKADGQIIYEKVFAEPFEAEWGDKIVILPSLTVRVSNA